MATGGDKEVYHGAEMNNGLRLTSLLIQVGTRAAKEVFMKQVKTCGEKNLQDLLNKEKQKMENHTRGKNKQKHPKLLYIDQFDKMYPGGYATQSDEDFDITLTILLCDILCGLPAPRSQNKVTLDYEQTWAAPASTLDPNDESEAADLIRLRSMRNTLFAHLPSLKISQDDFETHWDDLVVVLERLGASRNECEKYKQQALDPENLKKQLMEVTVADGAFIQEMCEQQYHMCRGINTLETKCQELHDALEATKEQSSEKLETLTSIYLRMMKMLEDTKHEKTLQDADIHKLDENITVLLKDVTEIKEKTCSTQSYGRMAGSPGPENLQKKIEGNSADLVESLAKTGAITWDYLIQKKIISKSDFHYIMDSNPTGRDQAREMLRLICQRPVKDHPMFLEALRESKEDKALEILGYGNDPRYKKK